MLIQVFFFAQWNRAKVQGIVYLRECTRGKERARGPLFPLPSSPTHRCGLAGEGPRDSLLPPDRSEDLTISWRRQILQSEAESQRIAVRKLLNRLQHPGWYVSRLQTIRCGYTACGGYGHLGGWRRLYPTPPRSPCMGWERTARGTSPKLASQCKPHAISLHCLDGILP